MDSDDLEDDRSEIESSDGILMSMVYRFRSVFHFFVQDFWIFLYQCITKIRDVGRFQSYESVVIFFGLVFITAVLFIYLLGKTKHKTLKIPPLSIPMIRHGKPRFRKRDKLYYYATRLKRKFIDIPHDEGTSKAKAVQQQIFKQLTRSYDKMRRLSSRDNSQPLLKKRAVPDHLLEPRYDEDTESSMPDDFLLVMNSIRVFVHIDKPLFAKLCQKLETITLESGEPLFRVGESDENIFVVHSGKLRVSITEPDGSMFTIHDVVKGGHVHSLLSILDVLTGNQRPYRTVSAVAQTPSRVLKLPVQALADVLAQSPETMVRIVQMIAVRLHRVTFAALNDYLGLSVELINQASLALPDSKVRNLLMRQNSMDESEQMGHTFTSTSTTSMGTPQQLSTTPPTTPQRPSGLCKKRDFNIRTGRSRSRSKSPTAYRPAPDTSGFEDAVQSFSTMDTKRGLEFGEARFQSDRSSSKEVAQLRKSRARDRPAEASIEELTSSDLKTVLKIAKEDLLRILGLDGEPELIENLDLSLTNYSAGATLAKQGADISHLYFVVFGELRLLQNVSESKAMISMFLAQPGDLVDVHSVLTGELSFFTIRVERSSVVVKIQREDVYALLRTRPKVVLNLSNLMVRRMSPFLRQIDFALEWMQVDAGRALYKQGDLSDCVYIVLNGRLRQVNLLPNGERSFVSELSKGELVGLLEVLSEQPRATTVISVRDTELARIPAELLNMIKQRQPQVVSRLIHILADRLLDRIQSPRALTREQFSMTPCSVTGGPGLSLENLRAVTLLGVNDKVPLEAFTLELQYAMTIYGSSMRLNPSILLQRLGPRALDSSNDYRLSTWLNAQEDAHNMLLYQCDPINTVWTRRCIRQADCVIVVGVASEDTSLGELESILEHDSKVVKLLVLLHPEDTESPEVGITAKWLNERPWVSQHYHIRCPKRVMRGYCGERLMRQYKRVFEMEANPMTDVARLARFLLGKAVGLVLGGGGARGAAHVGVIRAFQEVGIPIDIVGGTSIGSFMGALWAETTDLTRFIQKAREFFVDMSSLWKKIIDITYPVIAMFSGKGFNDAIRHVFKDRQVEDLWIPYFCITTDVSHSRMRVHTLGSIWRYVRSSMSLSGYLPPLCDPYDGSYLVDGGYVNNLPADVMLTYGPGPIFAIDVGSLGDTELDNYGDWISGTRLLLERWIPFMKPTKVLSLTEIQSRLAYVSSVYQLERVMQSGICEYLRPPIDPFQTLQFGSFDEIQEVGYQYAVQRIEEWRKQNKLQLFNFGHDPGRITASTKGLTSQSALSPISRQLTPHATYIDEKMLFTDLAEKVTRIDDGHREIYFDSSTDESESSYSETEVVSDPEIFEADFYEAKAAKYQRPRGMSADLNLTEKRVKFQVPVRRRSLDDIQEFSVLSSSV